MYKKPNQRISSPFSSLARPLQRRVFFRKAYSIKSFENKRFFSVQNKKTERKKNENEFKCEKSNRISLKRNMEWSPVDIRRSEIVVLLEIKRRSAMELASRFRCSSIRPEPATWERRRQLIQHCPVFEASGPNRRSHSPHSALDATHPWRTRRFVLGRLETLGLRKNYCNLVDTDWRIDLDTAPTTFADKNNDITNIVNYNNKIVERELDGRRVESLDSRTRKQTD